MVCADPVDGSLVVPDLGLDTVFGYQLSDAGALVETARTPLPAGTGPRHVAFSDTGTHLYVVGELANTVTTFERTAGGWRALGSVSTLPTGWSGPSTAAALRVRNDRLFVSTRGHDSIAMFAIDPLPSLLVHASARGRTPRDIALAPDSAHLLVANQDSNDIAVFAIEDTGLRHLSSTPAPTPVCLVVRPDPQA
jgi:6-phosphogluconolactonase